MWELLGGVFTPLPIAHWLRAALCGVLILQGPLPTMDKQSVLLWREKSLGKIVQMLAGGRFKGIQVGHQQGLLQLTTIRVLRMRKLRLREVHCLAPTHWYVKWWLWHSKAGCSDSKIRPFLHSLHHRAGE